MLWFSLNIFIFYFPYHVSCMLNFKGQGFKIKTIRHRSVYFVRLFFLESLPASDSVVFYLVRVLVYFWDLQIMRITVTPTVLFLMCLKWVYIVLSSSDQRYFFSTYMVSNSLTQNRFSHFVADKSDCSGFFLHAK